MSWVKLDDNFAGHRKVLAAGLEAAWLHIEGLCYCAQQETDGAILDAALVKLTQFSKPKAERLAVRLVEVGLWERNGAGWLIHDYLDYNPSKKELEARRETKRRAGQAGGLSKQAGRERELANG
ncbi:hypothetical protein LCGC14_0979510 [marine sediment metagenome]|uniref:Bacteriophage lambda Replication protein O N-terminal domain-containing protein n=1 Tax=marine sediment metagenome TaxID=412755 RepID=A0A0F9NVD3_9ZZZZ